MKKIIIKITGYAHLNHAKKNKKNELNTYLIYIYNNKYIKFDF
jgi:hypothetical protein